MYPLHGIGETFLVKTICHGTKINIFLIIVVLVGQKVQLVLYQIDLIF